MKRHVVFRLEREGIKESIYPYNLMDDGKVVHSYLDKDRFEREFPTISKLDNVKSIYYSCGVLMAITEDGHTFADPNLDFFKKFDMHSVDDFIPEITDCLDDIRSWKNVEKLYYFTQEDWAREYIDKPEFDPLSTTMKGRNKDDSHEGAYLTFGVIGLCNDGSVVKTGQEFDEDNEYLKLTDIKDVFTCNYGYALIRKNGSVCATKELDWMNKFDNVDYIVEHYLSYSETNKAYTIFFNDGTASFIWVATTNSLFKQLYNMNEDKISIQVDHAPSCVMINDFQWLQVTPDGLKSWTGYAHGDCYKHLEYNGEHLLVGPNRDSGPEQKRKLIVYKKPIKIAAPYDRYNKYKKKKHGRDLPWLAMYEDGTVKAGGFSFEKYNDIELAPGVVLSKNANDILFEDGELCIIENDD